MEKWLESRFEQNAVEDLLELALYNLLEKTIERNYQVTFSVLLITILVIKSCHNIH